MQTVTRFEPPGTAARTFLRFGRNCRFETLWAWLTLSPGDRGLSANFTHLGHGEAPSDS